MKSTIIQLSLLTWFLILGSCGENDDPIIPDEIPEEPVLKIALNETSINMGVSDKDTLTVTTDIGVLTAEYASSDPSIVAVDDKGIIEAMSLGSAEITVTVDDLIATCEVEVKLKTLELNKSEVTLKVTDLDTLVITSDLHGQAVVWESSDESVVSVDGEGRLQALKSGAAEVSASTGDLTVICKVEVDLTIFVGGSYKDFDAAYWKDGKVYPLTTDGTELGLYSHVNSIKVVQGKIYAGGQKKERLTTLWTNGEKRNLQIGGANAVKELAVLSNNILAVGGYKKVFLWNETDGNSFWTEDIDESAGASIYVENSDVYIAGTVNQGGIYRPTVWKNQRAFTLDYTTSHTVSDIFVSNGDFYTCASEFVESRKYKSKYWKNETEVELTDGSSFAIPKAIHVIGEDVYIGGYLNQRPVLWKNDETIFYAESGVTGSITELASKGDDLYVVGNISVGEHSNVGVVWKNGEEIFRTDLFDNAYLNCIEIK